jgi:hypothetical protein
MLRPLSMWASGVGTAHYTLATLLFVHLKYIKIKTFTNSTADYAH